MSMERLAWKLLIGACRWWASRYMDQWEMFSLRTPNGRVYVRIAYRSECPEAYEAVDRL